MKFLYGYKTKDNEMREGAIDAPSRNDVYRELKKQGIKPFKVELAPGFLNWLRSLGKRTYVIIVLVALSIVATIVIHSQSRTIEKIELSGSSPLPRHQIYGDPALMTELDRTDYAAAFDNDGDRVLARFAQPGQIVRPVAADQREKVASRLDAAIAIPDEEAIRFGDADSREVRELKRIVLGMRAELRRYLSNGVGTSARYLTRLAQRQEREAMIYYNAKHDLEKESDPMKWERINSSLRTIGLKTIPMPEKTPQNQSQNGVARTGEES